MVISARLTIVPKIFPFTVKLISLPKVAHGASVPLKVEIALLPLKVQFGSLRVSPVGIISWTVN